MPGKQTSAPDDEDPKRLTSCHRPARAEAREWARAGAQGTACEHGGGKSQEGNPGYGIKTVLPNGRARRRAAVREQSGPLVRAALPKPLC